jgi:hypothetical protein
MISSNMNGRKTTILSIFGIIFCANLLGQDCECEKDSILKDLISCDTINFDNNTNLYWSFNCDSSWLNFLDKFGNRKVIFSLGDGLVNLTGRLGYIFAFEYDNTFLIQNNVISGCCSPPTFYLYDKSTGYVKKKLGRIIFYSKDRFKPYIISITNSNYDSTNTGVYNSMTVYNINLDRTSYIKLSADEIATAMDNTEQMYPEYLFDEPIVSRDSIILTYYIRKPINSSDKPTKTIKVKMK